MNVKKLKEGDPVLYKTWYKREKGRVKGFCSDSNFVFVVYRCANDWENYKNYGGVKTPINTLTKIKKFWETKK